MSRFFKKNQDKVNKPLTDWDKSTWKGEDYRNHEIDFKKIDEEMKPIKEKNYSEVMCRWFWLQSKGAVRLDFNSYGYFEPIIKKEYEKYSNMYSRWSERNAFNEKIASQQTGIPLELPDIKRDLDKMANAFSVQQDFGQHDELSEFVNEATANF
jgi:hypothetical protein